MSILDETGRMVDERGLSMSPCRVDVTSRCPATAFTYRTADVLVVRRQVVYVSVCPCVGVCVQ